PRLAPDRDGPDRSKAFARLPAAQQVTRDGGQGLAKGLALANAQRRRDGLAEVADQDDHFHLLHRGRRGLRAVKAKAVRALRTAEMAQAKRNGDRRTGRLPGGGGRANASARGGRAAAVARLWRRAEAAFDRWSAQGRAFERLGAGLRLFAPDGRLNTPGRAQAEVDAALAELTGPEWSRLRRRLVGPKAFTFL